MNAFRSPVKCCTLQQWPISGFEGFFRAPPIRSAFIWVCDCYLQECSTLSCNIFKLSWETQIPCGVDHRSLHTRWSWHLKTNMRLWYHLICSTPLSSKISFIPPFVPARTPPSEPDLLFPSMPFEVKACVLRQRMNVSLCYGVTGLHSRLFDPVLGLKSFF